MIFFIYFALWPFLWMDFSWCSSLLCLKSGKINKSEKNWKTFFLSNAFVFFIVISSYDMEISYFAWKMDEEMRRDYHRVEIILNSWMLFEISRILCLPTENETNSSSWILKSSSSNAGHFKCELWQRQFIHFRSKFDFHTTNLIIKRNVNRERNWGPSIFNFLFAFFVIVNSSGKPSPIFLSIHSTSFYIISNWVHPLQSINFGFCSMLNNKRSFYIDNKETWYIKFNKFFQIQFILLLKICHLQVSYELIQKAKNWNWRKWEWMILDDI